MIRVSYRYEDTVYDIIDIFDSEMGSGRDKRKKNKGPRPGVGAAKTEKKTQKREAKEERREARKEKAEENDIDALLARFKLEDEANNSVKVVEKCQPPSARVYASVTPLNDKEVIMFGGEWLDPKRILCMSMLIYMY